MLTKAIAKHAVSPSRPAILPSGDVALGYGDVAGQRLEIPVLSPDLSAVRLVYLPQHATSENCYASLDVQHGQLHCAYKEDRQVGGHEEYYGWIWREDGHEEPLGRVGGEYPAALGHGWVAWASPDNAQGRRDVYRRRLAGGAVEVARANIDSSQGISHIEPDGAVVLRFVDHPWGRQDVAGDLLVTENHDDGLFVTFTGLQGYAQPFAGQRANTPRAIQAGAIYYLSTWGSPHGVRMAIVSPADLRLKQPRPVAVPPFSKPLHYGWIGYRWTASAPKPGGNCVIVDGATSEVDQAARDYPALIVDGWTLASITGAAPHWPKVAATWLDIETTPADVRPGIRQNRRWRADLDLAPRDILVYVGQHTDWSVPNDPDIVRVVELYPNPGEPLSKFEMRGRDYLQAVAGRRIGIFGGAFGGPARDVIDVADAQAVILDLVLEQLWRCDYFFMWKYGGAGGAYELAQREPAILDWHHAIGRVVTLAGLPPIRVPVIVTPSPTPTPEPEPEPEPTPVPQPSPAPKPRRRRRAMFASIAIPFDVIETFDALIRRAGEPEPDPTNPGQWRQSTANGPLGHIPDSLKQYLRVLYYDFIYAKHGNVAPGDWSATKIEALEHIKTLWSEGVPDPS